MILAAVGILGYLVLRHQPASPQIALPFTGLNNPTGAAVDTAGNLYVTDNGHNRVLRLAAGSTTQSVLPFTGLNGPGGVAVDSAGECLRHRHSNNRVLKLAAGSTTQSVLPFTGLNGPGSVAVDTAGNLYATDIQNNRVLKLAAGSTTQSVLPFTDLQLPRRCGGGQRWQPLRHRQRQQSGAEDWRRARPPRACCPSPT